MPWHPLDRARTAGPKKQVQNVPLDTLKAVPKQVWQAPDGKCFETEEECQRYEATNGILRLFFDKHGELLDQQEDRQMRKAQLSKKVKEAFGRSSYGLSSTIEWLLVAAKTEHDLFHHSDDLPEVANWLKRIASERKS